jgi:hypothetical protein
LVVTHRAPVRSITSVCSLVSAGAQAWSSRPDPQYLGRQWTTIVEEQLRRMLAFRQREGDGRFFDVHNDELVREPMAVLERLYAWLGAEITPDARRAFAARVASNPKGVYGAHHYDPATYGLDVGALRERFRFYTDRFDIRLEP